MRIVLFILLGTINSLFGQDTTSLAFKLANTRISAYGAVNYYSFNWQTLPNKRNALDPERLNLYVFHDFNHKLEFKSEIEFEHGGTGSTLEFDQLEEFGEFEQSIEKGGEVVLEQINLQYKFSPKLKLRFGKMRFYMGNASKQDQPREYFTAYRSEVENTLLPLGWYETGLELSGDLKLGQNEFPYLSYKVYAISGLDNTGFSSLNWIRRGYQTRFETINANNLAYALRFDYIFKKDSEIGLCFYAGNPTGNRPKNDFTNDSWVMYGDMHFAYESKSLRLRAYGMYGNIQNSESLSEANRNLSNNLEVKRTPIGKAAAGAYAEAAYDILPFITKCNHQLYLFTRTEWYDSMYKTQGNIFNNPRYERKILTVGFNFFITETVVIKAHQAWRTLGSNEKENTFCMGFGFDF